MDSKLVTPPTGLTKRPAAPLTTRTSTAPSGAARSTEGTQTVLHHRVERSAPSTSAPASKVRVLLADDHPFLVEGLKSFLATRDDIEIIGEAVNGEDAVQQCEALRPSVVVMDITMPRMNGIEATAAIKARCPDAKVLVLTMHQKREFSSQAIDSGARGYINKDAPPSELVRAIKTVDAGDVFFPAWVTQGFVTDFVRGEVKGHAAVTAREREVLKLIAEGFCNKEAASILGISVRTVEKHRERIMDKLELRSVVDLTKYAIAEGVVEVDS